MPDLGHELHLGWIKGVGFGHTDVKLEGAAFVWCVGGSCDGALQGAEVVAFERYCDEAFLCLVRLDDLIKLPLDALCRHIRHDAVLVITLPYL